MFHLYQCILFSFLNLSFITSISLSEFKWQHLSLIYIWSQKTPLENEQIAHKDDINQSKNLYLKNMKSD